MTKGPLGTSLPNNKIKISNSVIPTATSHNFPCWHVIFFKLSPCWNFQLFLPPPYASAVMPSDYFRLFTSRPPFLSTVCSFQTTPHLKNPNEIYLNFQAFLHLNLLPFSILGSLLNAGVRPHLFPSHSSLGSPLSPPRAHGTLPGT